jgi:hypothetical protein
MESLDAAQAKIWSHWMQPRQKYGVTGCNCLLSILGTASKYGVTGCSRRRKRANMESLNATDFNKGFSYQWLKPRIIGLIPLSLLLEHTQDTAIAVLRVATLGRDMSQTGREG